MRRDDLARSISSPGGTTLRVCLQPECALTRQDLDALRRIDRQEPELALAADQPGPPDASTRQFAPDQALRAHQRPTSPPNREDTQNKRRRSAVAWRQRGVA